MRFEPAIASASLGNPTAHSITARLTAAAAQGFKHVEIVEADLLTHAQSFSGATSPENQIQAAESVKKTCDELGLSVFVLQPFWFYEGLLDRDAHKSLLLKLELWMKLAAVLDTQMIQIPTNWLQNGTTGDVVTIVADLVEMAEMGLKQDPVVLFAYEGVAWGTHIDTWQGTWDIVKRVDRSNFGLCLDTFHIAGRVWGDPTAASGAMLNADRDLEDSLTVMVRDLDVRKVFYVQVGDAERLGRPLVEEHPFHQEDQPAMMSWSRNARVFAFSQEEGGCLPVEKVTRAIVDGLGYTGIISLEMFSRHHFDADPTVPERYAARASSAWTGMIKELE